LTQATPGQELDIIGPLGKPFPDLPEGAMAALVGGGVGIPPMMYLAQQLRQQDRQAVAFVGARTRAVLPLTIDPLQPPSQAGWPGLCTAEFAACGVETVVATDDGSLGMTGLVSEALERWLCQKNLRPQQLVIYACGPLGMMKAVAAAAAAGGYRCYLALERHMACGLGACQSCIVKVRTGGSEGWKYALACKDGTVFDAQELVW
jgi:dihydroorotate dehydrogenase electron transfer subunit